MVGELNNSYGDVPELGAMATAIIAEDTTIILANEEFARMAGYSREEIENKIKWVEFIAEEDLARLAKQHNRHKGNEQSVSVEEARFVDRNGNRKHVQITATGIPGENLSILSLDESKRCGQLKGLLLKYRPLFDQVRDIVLFITPGGRIIEVNAATERAYGYSRAELLSMTLRELRSPGSRENINTHLAEAQNDGTLFEVTGLRKDGSTFLMEVNSHRADIMGERLIISVGRDITARRLRERKLIKMQAKTQVLIDAIPDMMFIVGSDGIIKDSKLKQNPLVAMKTQITGKNVDELLPRKLASQIMRGIESALSYDKLIVIEFKISLKTQQVHYEARIVASDDNEVLVIVRDVSDRKMMEQQMQYMSFHDALTSLYNRTYFEQEMKRLESSRCGEIGIMVCDVDGLKLINDSLGHTMGDKVLKDVAGILKGAFRANDLVARIGGDEFAVLLSNGSEKVFLDACGRIDKMIYQHNNNKADEMMPIGLSVGYAVCQDVDTSLEDVFKEADNKMYRQKLHHHKSSRSAIVEALTKALQARDFLTDGHGERLQKLAVLLAKAAGVSDNNISDISLLARFHDIGKVGIPDSILFKKGRLTAAEYTAMKAHCEIGYRIALSAPDLVPIADWILLHHEWWNGEGYPTGTARTSIPIECRILSIVDAFDAMTSDRPYRKAMRRTLAIAELKKYSGTQFDPTLVDLFVEAIGAKNLSTRVIKNSASAN